MTTDEQKRERLLAAGWAPGSEEEAGYWWQIGVAGWGRTLDEAYDYLCDQRDMKG